MKTSISRLHIVEEIIAKQIGWFHEAVTRAPWFEWLRRELAPTPGRWETTVRLVVRVALVPEVALSATEGVHQAESGRVERQSENVVLQCVHSLV